MDKTSGVNPRANITLRVQRLHAKMERNKQCLNEFVGMWIKQR